jgi:hypothetical protein
VLVVAVLVGWGAVFVICRFKVPVAALLLLLLVFEKAALVEVVSKAKFVTASAVGPEANATLVVASVPLAAGFAEEFAKVWVVFDNPMQADK